MSKNRAARSARRGRPKATGPSAKAIGIVVGGTVALVAAVVLVMLTSSPKAPERVQGLPQDVETKGASDARVTLTEYSDFQ